MEDNGVHKFTKLKELLLKWQHVKSLHIGGISPAVSERLAASVYSESDEESCHGSELPSDVPKGYLAVYVGPELRRFIIPTSYLSHQLFKVLLEKAEEEFGFDHCGGITIPCEIETFKYLLKCMEKENSLEKDESDNRSDV